MAWAISLPVIRMNHNSIIYRITGLVFLAVALTVFLLIYLANLQMTEQFKEYLVVQHRVIDHRMGPDRDHQGAYEVSFTMGPLEQSFLASVHKSLIWVGLAILAAGSVASYMLARSITVPLRNLSQAAEQIERGNFNQRVCVESKDEIGQLAAIFNRMSEALQMNSNLRRQLLANIAHELRTPLAVIQGHLEGMIDGVIEPGKEQLTSLHEEAIRLNRLITDLRDLSLAEVGQLGLELKTGDVKLLLARVVLLLKPLADKKRLDIVLELPEQLPPIVVDHDRISQVFYNILVNAIRYSPNEGQVKITVELNEDKEKHWLCLSFQDHGPGIKPEDIDSIFDHFYRGEKSRDRKSGGSGLGLAIVKQLVEIHGGWVAVRSEAGKGSLFQVSLPLDKTGGNEPG